MTATYEIQEVRMSLDNSNTSSDCQVEWQCGPFFSVSSPLSGVLGPSLDSVGDSLILGPGDGQPAPPYQYEFLLSSTSGPLLEQWDVALVDSSMMPLDLGWTGSGTLAFDCIVNNSCVTQSGCTALAQSHSKTLAVLLEIEYQFCIGPPPSVAFCFGDGSGAQCPCGSGGTGLGCPNTFTAGASIAGTGASSFSNDSFGLEISNLPPNRPGLAIKGSTPLGNGLGSVVGDGLFCTNAEFRSQVLQSNGNGVVVVDDWRGVVFGSFQGVANIGQPTYYQYWYRDSDNPCTGSFFNFSNAIETSWEQ